MAGGIGLVVVGIIGYALGSLNFAMFVGRIKGIDFRETGTGNFGTMNVFRATQSVLWAGLTLLWDAGKGIASVFVSRHLSTVLGFPAATGALVAALSAILGHNHSFLLGFKSGRGIATFLGTSLVINPIIAIVWLLNWVPGYLVTGVLSVGQILASVYTPALVLLMPVPAWHKVFAAAAGMLMVLGHLEKISAIRTGKEPKNYWNLRKKRKVKY